MLYPSPGGRSRGRWESGEPLHAFQAFGPQQKRKDRKSYNSLKTFSENWKMMERAPLLVVYCLIMSVLSSPLYPALQFGQRSSSMLVTSSIGDQAELLPAADVRNKKRQEAQNAEYRSGRHADAIFTNSYRKLLGQISARKFLQTAMGKRLGFAEAGKYMKRDSKFDENLTTIQRQQG
ncbi:hypothetical protein GJAV_G00172870 [Gymnothorax javanicus]|nr:hypothetical protein GJAV_G00172870 [Gymnothorax javanicus]